MLLVNNNFKRGPVSRDRVYEALNALAITAAIVIKGCGDAPANDEAHKWFELALGQQLSSGD